MFRTNIPESNFLPVRRSKICQTETRHQQTPKINTDKI